jgi:hypothetical protein
MIFLVACDTTYAAMTMQESLAALKPTVIPTPRDISESCGMSLRFGAEDEQKAREIVSAIPQAKGFCALYAETATYQHYELICQL